MNKKLRLLVTAKCHNKCPMCCNNQFDFEKIPVVDRLDYDEISITGGEPLLPDCNGKTMCLADGKQKNFFVHRLVAMAFIHKPKDREYVDHKDCNPKNNCVDNLRWVTAYENAHNRNTKKHVKLAAKTMTRYTVAICRISSSGYVKKYPSIKSAVKDGYYSGSIYKCLRGQMKTHRGYRWAYQS